jgi:hypothetical protein
MNRKSVFMLLGLCLLLGASFCTSSARAEDLNLDFTLVNSTGWGIKEIYIGPSSSDEWGDSVIKEVLKDGESLKITFHPKATATKWDIMIVWKDGGDKVYWKGYKLTDISKITLKYDEQTKVTSASTE